MKEMSIIEDPRIFLYYQNKYPEREPLILFGGCTFRNDDSTTRETIRDLKKFLRSLFDSIEQAYQIRFNLSEVVQGISGELIIELSNLKQQLLENSQDYNSQYGKNRLLRLQMMNQLYQLNQTNAVWFTSNRFPPFQLFFLHWLETILNEFFLADLLNAISLNVINRLGFSANAHAMLMNLAAEISIHIRNTQNYYTI